MMATSMDSGSPFDGRSRHPAVCFGKLALRCYWEGPGRPCEKYRHAGLSFYHLWLSACGTRPDNAYALGVNCRRPLYIRASIDTRFPTREVWVESGCGYEVVRVGSYRDWFPRSALATDLSLLRRQVVNKGQTYLSRARPGRERPLRRCAKGLFFR